MFVVREKGEGKREMCARRGREVGGACAFTMAMQNVQTAL